MSNDLQNLPPSELSQQRMADMGFVVDSTFSFEGFQVVRGEYFAHTYEPSITLNAYKLSVNRSCLNRLPDVDYVQVLVNPKEKKLVIRPSNEDEKGAFRWRAKGKQASRQVICKVFFSMIMDLMEWNPGYRYKLLGKMVMSKSEYLYVFDLTEPEIYQRLPRDPVTGKVIHTGSRQPMYPDEWKNQFGLPIEENRKSLQVSIYNGYIVYELKEDNSSESSDNPDESSDERKDENDH